MSFESSPASNSRKEFASSAQENPPVSHEWTIDDVAEAFKSNIIKFTGASEADVDLGEDTEGHQTMDIRVQYEDEESRMISFHVTGPDAMSISDLVMLAESRDQIGSLFGKTPRDATDNERDATGLGYEDGYDDQDVAA